MEFNKLVFALKFYKKNIKLTKELIKIYESKLDVDNIMYYTNILETLIKLKYKISRDIEDCYISEPYVIDLEAYKLTKKEFKEKK